MENEQMEINHVENTYLRPLKISDLDNIMQWINDPEITKNFAKFNHKFTRSEEKKYLQNLLKSKDEKLFAVENEKREYIGQIGVHIHWLSRTARLGIIIGIKDAWGKGHSTRALKKFLKIAFKRFKLNKIWVIFFKDNKKMKHIFKKLGFSQEGILKEEYFHKGRYHDMIRMALLRRNWRK